MCCCVWLCVLLWCVLCNNAFDFFAQSTSTQCEVICLVKTEREHALRTDSFTINCIQVPKCCSSSLFVSKLFPTMTFCMTGQALKPITQIRPYIMFLYTH